MEIIIETIIAIISEFGLEIALATVTILTCIFKNSDKLKKLKKRLEKLKRKEGKLAKKLTKTVQKENKIEKEIEKC